MEDNKIEWSHIAPGEMDNLYTGVDKKSSRLMGPVRENGGSGGYVEHIFRYAAKELFDVVIDGPLKYQLGRNADMREVTLEVNFIM